MRPTRPTIYATECATLEVTPRVVPASKPAPPPPAREGSMGDVLLLDDNTDFREVLCDYLRTCGYEVTAVADGAAGVRAVRERPFDLMICDMMMPIVDGEMFYWAVTRLRRAAGQRFLFMTGHQSEPRVQAFFQRVNATVLIKPFKLDALTAAVRGVMKKLC